MSRSSYGNPPKGPNKGTAAECHCDERQTRVSPTAPTVNPSFSTPKSRTDTGVHVPGIGAGDNKPSNGNKPTGGF